MIITKLDGTIINTSDYGIKLRDFNVSSPAPRTFSEVIEGRHGFIDLGTDYEGREINASFLLDAGRIEDYEFRRNEVFRLFDSRQSFYVTDERELGKRWLVKIDSTYSIEQIRKFGMFDVKFISALPFAESIGTTLEPVTFRYDDRINRKGLYLTENDYVVTATSFRIYNASDTTIEPRYLPLVLRYKGASNGLNITNTTTGDIWSYNGTSVDGDVIELNGIRSFKNDISIFRETNYNVITLAEGWNEFTLTGTSGDFVLSFEHRFYYL